MKKWMLTTTAVGLVALGLQSAQAGDREWATVGKVLTGVAAAVVISKAVEAPPAYASVSYATPVYSVTYSSTPPPAPAPVVYAAPPVVYAPAPVVVYQPVPVCPPRPVLYAPARCGFWGHAYGRGHWHH